MDLVDGRINIDQPLWDQSSYTGRWKHFAFISDCSTMFASEKKLREAKQLCDDYKMGKEPPGTTMSDILRAKQLRDSAFHPDTGELMHIAGRMSTQMPLSVILTTAMLTFYKSAAAVVLCQIVNQAHNALVNYTNRNALSENHAEKNTIRIAFLYAVVASSMMALASKKILSRRGPIAARWVPFCAVVAGHSVNVPVMRQREITGGIPIFTEDSDEPIMKSKVAAVKGISECVISRIAMCLPSLVMIPLLSHRIKPYCFYQRRPWIIIPIEASLCAIFCTITVPSGLAIFPQCNSMKPQLLKLYPDEYEEFKNNSKEDVDKVYYNKGL